MTQTSGVFRLPVVTEGWDDWSMGWDHAVKEVRGSLSPDNGVAVERIAEVIYLDMTMAVRPWDAAHEAERSAYRETARAVLATIANA